MANDYKERNYVIKVKLFCMDVDGTLTDGKIYMNRDGEALKAFNVKDGYAIRNILSQYEIIPIIITGRQSEIVLRRSWELGIKEVYQNVKNKMKVLDDLLTYYQCTEKEVAYIGDDIPDILCMKRCGISGCPADACEEVKRIVSFVASHKGGDGAVREFIEWLVVRMTGGRDNEAN